MRIKFTTRTLLLATGYVSVVLALFVLVNDRPLLGFFGFYTFTYLTALMLIFAWKWRDIEFLRNQRKSNVVRNRDLSKANDTSADS